MDRLKRVTGRGLGAQTIAGLGGCKLLRRRVTRGPSGYPEGIGGTPNVRYTTWGHGGRMTA
jgi:hypothetical protein